MKFNSKSPYFYGVETDHMFLGRALELAGFALGNTYPNPLVGCVIVHDGHIIGEGWHREYGKEHAEVNAIRSVKDPSLLPGSTLYVSLEPCNHQGKTPPCTELIIESGIKKVVVATKDPNPIVSGKGIERLKNSGIEVIEGILEDEAQFINRRFIIFHQKKRPYIILKWAESQDGFMDKIRNAGETGSFPISGAAAQRLNHKWRTEEQAILVGTRTAINDNPLLTARLWPGKSPVRILIDEILSVPQSARIFDGTSETIVFNRIKDEIGKGFTAIKLDFTIPIIPQIFSRLYEMGIQSVLVEGGAETHRYFLDNNYWDEIRRIRSPLILEYGLPSPLISLHPESEMNVGKDKVEIFYNDLS